jgi:hypothetical protein
MVLVFNGPDKVSCISKKRRNNTKQSVNYLNIGRISRTAFIFSPNLSAHYSLKEYEYIFIAIANKQAALLINYRT